MVLFSRRRAGSLAALAGLLLTLSAPGLAQSPANHPKQLVHLLSAGGYNIVVRQADTDPFNFDDITKQRNLNDQAVSGPRRSGMRFVARSASRSGLYK
jgi:hypothetical protein